MEFKIGFYLMVLVDSEDRKGGLVGVLLIGVVDVGIENFEW